MTVKINLQRPLIFGSRKPHIALPGKPPRQPPSFRAALSTCMEEWKVQQPGKIAAVASPAATEPARNQPSSTLLARAWSWFRSRYKLTSVKRLRLSETLPLGEKRFVALVSVEGREFLIGGGATGVSLLAQLGKSAESGKGFAANVEKASA
jgi:hypothetical protein